MTTAPLLPYRRHLGATLSLGLPLVASHVAQSLVQVTDTLMLGWYDVEALAAGVLGSSAFFFIFVVGSGFSFAVTPMVAAAASSGNETQIRRVTRMGLWLSILFGALTYPIFWFSGPILLWMGQQPEIAALSEQYLRIIGLAMIPALLVMVLKAYLAALERAQVVLWVTVIGALANAGLNWLLIFGNWGLPELGIRGAALASLCLHLIMFAMLAAYGRRVLPEHQIFTRFLKPDWEVFNRVFRLGFPIGVTHLAEAGLFSASAIMVGWIGTLPLAAHGIALQIASMTFMVHIGLGQAATVRAGQSHGRQDSANLRRGAVVVTALSLAMIAVTVAVFLAIPETLIGAFLSSDEPQRDTLLAIGASLLAMAALFQLADGMQVIALSLLRGVQDTQVPMIIAAISYWLIGAPAGYILGIVMGWGAVGVWLGLVIGLGAAAILLMDRFWRQGRWQVSPA